MTSERRTSLASRVLAAYKEWGPGTSVTGEWERIRRVARGPLFAALESRDPARIASVIFEPEGRDEWTGLASASVDVDRDLATWRSIVGDDVAELSENGVLYPDATRHDAEAWALLAGGARSIADIGGGYGELAYRLVNRCSSVRYVDVDLADTLYLAYGFLAPRLPDGAVSLGYSPDAPISLVPDSHIPAGLKPDVVVNYRSWGEMSYADVARYFALIVEWAPQFVVHENSASHSADPYASVFVDPELLVCDYPPLVGYEVISNVPSMWSAGAGRYVHQVLARRA